MDRPPELWAFLLANTFLFVCSGVLTVLCYLAHRRSDGRGSFLTTTAGFALVVLGGVIEPVYQFGLGGGYTLNGTELLWLQTVEGLFLASGLGLLFYAITRYRPGSAARGDDRPEWTDEDVAWRNSHWDD